MKAKNVGLFMVSLSMSLGLWLYVQSQEARVETITKSFIVERTGLNEQEFVLNDSSVPRTIDVEVSGLPEELEKMARYRDEQFRAILDLSDATAGTNTYSLRLEAPEDLRVRWADAGAITVDIDPLHRREYEVTVSPVNTPPGQALADAIVRPPTVTILASPNALEQVAEVRASIDLQNYKPGDSYTVDVQVFDASGNLVAVRDPSPKTVVVTPALRKRLKEKMLVVTPSWGGALPADARIVNRSFRSEPGQVSATAIGDAETLEALDTVSTKPIDLTGLAPRPEPYRRQIELVVPNGVRLQRKSVTVTFRIEANPLPSGPSNNAPPTNDTDTASTGG